MPEPEHFALVGPGGQRDDHQPADDTLSSVGDGEMLWRMLEERRPGTRWRYYHDEQLVPEGVTFFYAHESAPQDVGQHSWKP